MHRLAASIVVSFALGAAAAAAAEPIRLHPENPHYFLFRGRPTILITATEHYGAVLNLDFDYIRYLDTLKSHGFNLTRVFAGTYREVPGSFNITGNTLAPAKGKFVCPWARSSTSGASDGLAKFDLNRWDDAYFRRLKDFATEAGKRGIVVELVLFCTMYDENVWRASPMNAANNVQGIGKVGRYEVFSGNDEKLLEVQRAVTRKFVERAGHVRQRLLRDLQRALRAGRFDDEMERRDHRRDSKGGGIFAAKAFNRARIPTWRQGGERQSRGVRAEFSRRHA